MKQYLIAGLALMLAVMAGIPGVVAQDDEQDGETLRYRVFVRFNRIEAYDLQENSVIDDGEDEIFGEYGILEMGKDGEFNSFAWPQDFDSRDLPTWCTEAYCSFENDEIREDVAPYIFIETQATFAELEMFYRLNEWDENRSSGSVSDCIANLTELAVQECLDNIRNEISEVSAIDEFEPAIILQVTVDELLEAPVMTSDTVRYEGDIGGSGAYRLDYEAFAAPITQFDAIGLEQDVVNTLERGASHLYPFEASAGDIISIKVGASTPARNGTGEQYDPTRLDTVIVLMDEDGEVLDSNDDVQPNIITNSAINGFVVPDDGTYLIEVTSYEYLSGGEYTLRIEN